MDLTKIGQFVNWNAFLHNSTDPEKSLVATDVKPVYEFKEKKKTQNVIAFMITAVDFSNSFEKYLVRIDVTEKPLNIPDGGYVSIYLQNLTGKFYMDFANGETKVALRATGVEVLE